MKRYLKKLLIFSWQKRFVTSFMVFRNEFIITSRECLIKLGLYDIQKWAKEFHDRIKVGKHTYGFPLIYIYDKQTKLVMGDYCSIAKDVKFFLGGNHNKGWASTYPFTDYQDYRGDTVIGNDVWIGRGTMILSGSQISDGVIIGAGAVVSGSIEPYAIVVGNPIKVIKYRFEQKTIDTLLQEKWWTWSEEEIKNNIKLLTEEYR